MIYLLFSFFGRVKSRCVKKIAIGITPVAFLNLFLFKNPKDIYLNNKELTFNQLTMLRLFLFEKFNNSKPFFN